jgi:hypothetical protein
VKKLRALDKEALTGLPWLPTAVGEAVYERLHASPEAKS